MPLGDGSHDEEPQAGSFDSHGDAVGNTVKAFEDPF
jgi:hypothetical protein